MREGLCKSWLTKAEALGEGCWNSSVLFIKETTTGNLWHEWKKKYSNIILLQFYDFLKVFPILETIVVVVQSCSCVWFFTTPWTAACQASLSLTIFWSLPKFMSIKSVIPSNHLILYCPLPFLFSVFPSIRIFSSDLPLCIRWPNYWSFRFSISPFKEYSGLMSFKVDWLISLPSRRLSRVFSSTTVQKHQFFDTSPSLLYSS